MEFKELTKKDAQITLALELDKLMKTLPEAQKELVQREFDGYQKLFAKFLVDTGPSVIWDKIERLPPGSVRRRKQPRQISFN